MTELNQNSKDLSNSLDEKKIQAMAEEAVLTIFNKYDPSNAEVIVFAMVACQAMLNKAIMSRTPYPKKMQVGCESGHLISLEIVNPTSPINKLNELILPKH